MRRGDGNVEGSQVIEPGRRGHAVVALLALVALELGLGQMDVQTRVVRLGLGHATLDHALRRGVLAVHAHVDLHAAVTGVLVLGKELLVHRRHGSVS